MSVFSAMSRPSRVALNGVFGRGLEHHGVAGGQRLPELVDGDLEREVPRHDRADDADRLVPDLASWSAVRSADTNASPRSVSQSNSSISLAGYCSAVLPAARPAAGRG